MLRWNWICAYIGKINVNPILAFYFIFTQTAEICRVRAGHFKIPWLDSTSP